jgi:hypothetical protein
MAYFVATDGTADMLQRNVLIDGFYFLRNAQFATFTK